MQARNSLFGRTTSVLGATVALALASTSAAQVTYSFNWNANQTGWTGSFARNVNNPCAIASTRFNLWASAPTGTLISPNTGTATGVSQTISYNYKAYEFSSGAPTPAPWGSFDVQYGPSAAGPWTTFATISNEAQSLGVCIPKSHVFTPPAGPLFIRWNATWTAGDFYLAFDDVSITVTPPCTTPAPGNTVGPASGCVGDSIVLSLQNNTPGATVSYQWYESTVSASGPFTAVGTNQASYSATLTGNSWYYCDVTCSVGPVTTSSNVLAVTIPAPVTLPQDWETVDCGSWSLVPVIGTDVPNVDPTNSGFGVGTACIQLDFWDIFQPNEIAVVSPVLTPVAPGQFFLFDAASCVYFGNADALFLEESSDGGTTWTTVASWNNGPTGDLNTALTPDQADYGQGISVDPSEWTTLGGPITPGTDRIRLRGLSDFGNSIYVDNFRLGTSGPAYHAVRGVGCYDFSVYQSSFVELFADSPAAKAKLDGNALFFINTGSAYQALWVAGGASAYVPPGIGATTLTFAPDNDDGTVTITPTFGASVIPGGTTASWTVGTNGIVSASATGITDFTPTLAEVGTHVDLNFYTWRDWNADELGSGPIQSEEVGNMLYITWNGVEAYGTPSPNVGTWQVQINMASGDVNLVWVSFETSTSTSDVIVGCTLPGTSVTPPSSDLTTALPFLMGGDINQVAMGLSVVGRPINNGTPPNYTISNIPEFFPGTGIYGCAIVFGFVSYLPGGLDLGGPFINIGAPGCFAYQSQDVTIILGNVGAPSITFPLTWSLPSVPAGPAWMQAVGQFFPGSLPNGQNPGGYLTSNSLEIYINSF